MAVGPIGQDEALNPRHPMIVGSPVSRMSGLGLPSLSLPPPSPERKKNNERGFKKKKKKEIKRPQRAPELRGDYKSHRPLAAAHARRGWAGAALRAARGRALIGCKRYPSGPCPAPPRRCLPGLGARRSALGARAPGPVPGPGPGPATGTGTVPSRDRHLPPREWATGTFRPSPSRYRPRDRRPRPLLPVPCRHRPHHDEVSVPAAGCRSAPRSPPPRPLRLQQGASGAVADPGGVVGTTGSHRGYRAGLRDRDAGNPPPRCAGSGTPRARCRPRGGEQRTGHRPPPRGPVPRTETPPPRPAPQGVGLVPGTGHPWVGRVPGCGGPPGAGCGDTPGGMHTPAVGPGTPP